MKSTNGCGINFDLRLEGIIEQRRAWSTVLILLFTVFFLVLSGIAFSKAFAASGSSKISYSKDNIIVVYKDGTSTTKINKQLDANDSANSTAKKLDSNTKYAVAEVPDDQTVSETVKKYEKSSIVKYAQPNYKYKALSTNYGVNDTYSSYLWHFNNINVAAAAATYKAFSASKSVSTTNVAIIDTGVNVDHEDLGINKNLSVDITSSSNGNYSKLSEDEEGHGTHVTGIVDALSNNSMGVAGVGSTIAYNDDNEYKNNLNVFVENVFSHDSSYRYYAYDADVINGIKYAIDNKAQVINMSLGGTGGSDKLLTDALDSCYNSGITVVCAAGNDGGTYAAEYVNYPSDYDTCISVTATDNNNKITSYSSHNAYKDIAAPGGSGENSDYYIFSTYKNSYAEMAGTSMAAPVVTGVVAAMYSINPKLTVDQVKKILYSTATDLGKAGRDDYYGNGLINANKAIVAAAYYAGWTSVTVSKDKISKLKSRNRRLYVTAKKISGASGYQIKFSKYKSMKKSSYKTRTSYKITSRKLTKGRYYYVKVRAYKLDSAGDKIYGSWSNKKKVKIRA